MSLNFTAFLTVWQQPLLCSQFHKFLCEFFLKSHSFSETKASSITSCWRNRVDDQFWIAFAFHCKEDYCNNSVPLNIRKNQCSNETNSCEATLKYSFPKIELPSDIAESSKQNIYNAATF